MWANGIGPGELLARTNTNNFTFLLPSYIWHICWYNSIRWYNGVNRADVQKSQGCKIMWSINVGPKSCIKRCKGEFAFLALLLQPFVPSKRVWVMMFSVEVVHQKPSTCSNPYWDCPQDTQVDTDFSSSMWVSKNGMSKVGLTVNVRWWEQSWLVEREY